MQQFDASLQRLSVISIDFYFCHCFHNPTPVAETLRALDDLTIQDKILYATISE